MTSDVLLEVRSISKAFGSVQALTKVSFSLRAGRVHTLLGENGAGKSTLMKILAGVIAPSSGEILLEGKEVRFHNPGEVSASGIAIIFQELSLASNLSVAENIFAAHTPAHFGFVNTKELEQKAVSLLENLGFPIDPFASVATLSMAQRQLVEIAKALSHPARVVIMDEPTSSLSDQEAALLFNLIAKLKEQNYAVVYISHRMEEIKRISDDISILRDGHYVGTYESDTISIDELIAKMVGRQMNAIYPPILKPSESQFTSTQKCLEVEDLASAGQFDALSFHVNKGEVLGFFGLVGAGRSEVMNALFGTLKGSGTIRLNGEKILLNNPAASLASGIAFVTENRKEQGLVLAHSVAHNINMIAVHNHQKEYARLNLKAENKLSLFSVASLAIKTAHIDQAASELSGGNQQKIVLAKCLAIAPTLLILDEPTRGVDVGAKYEIYLLIRQLAALGTAIILVSSELPEVLAMSDRLLVMRAKKIVKQFSCSKEASEQVTPESVMHYATA